MKTRQRILSATAAASAALLVSALPASAQTMNFTTSGKGDAGWVTGYVSSIFVGTHEVDLTAWTDDHCGANPAGNGMGAYLYVRVYFTDGSHWSAPLLSDTNGCDNGGDFWDPVLRWSGKTVNYTTARLCEEDRNGSKATICTAWKKDYRSNG